MKDIDQKYHVTVMWPCMFVRDAHGEDADRGRGVTHFFIPRSSSWRVNFFLRASEIREAESSSLRDVQPRENLPNRTHTCAMLQWKHKYRNVTWYRTAPLGASHRSLLIFIRFMSFRMSLTSAKLVDLESDTVSSSASRKSIAGRSRSKVAEAVIEAGGTGSGASSGSWTSSSSSSTSSSSSSVTSLMTKEAEGAGWKLAAISNGAMEKPTVVSSGERRSGVMGFESE